MVPLNITIPEDFIKEEERCGYVISSKMKEVWAVQIDMLKELEKVCDKYGLTYYADSGTLIGAVRHKGYIPWDDDIDLVMLRKDYNKLLEVAPKEFKSPYFLQNCYTDKDYIRGHSQMRNSATTGSIKEDVDKPFNKGIFIDIFPLDNIPDSEFMFKLQIFRLKKLWKLLRKYKYRKPGNSPAKESFISVFSKLFYSVVDYRKVFRHYENVCSKYMNKKTRRVSYIEYSRGKEKHLWNTESFSKSHKVPFEFTDINIPDGYDDRLTIEYNDYMTIKNIPTTHGDVILDTNVPYTSYFKKRRDKNEKV